MRVLGLVLVVIGLAGIVLGVLAALGIPLVGTQAFATWKGVGPMIGGLALVGLGAYAALARA